MCHYLDQLSQESQLIQVQLVNSLDLTLFCLLVINFLSLPALLTYICVINVILSRIKEI